MGPRPLLMILLLGLILIAPSGYAHAQQRFELGEEGFEQVEQPDPDSPEGRLHEIRRALADDRPGDAIDLASDWIDDHPNHPSLPVAYRLRGDAKVARKDYYKALFDYEVVLRQYPDSDQYRVALERELTIAQAFGRGVKRKLWGMRIVSAYGEAEEILIRIQERAPGSDLAERAGIELADFYYRRSEMSLAAEAYDLFLENFPNSQWREHAMKRQILANLAKFKGPRFDPTGLVEARIRLEEYQRRFPAAAEQFNAQGYLTRIDQTLAQRKLLIAQWYERRGNDVSAVSTYKQLVQDYPATPAAREALAKLRELDPSLLAEDEGERSAEPAAQTPGEAGTDGSSQAPADPAEPAPAPPGP